MRVSWTALGKQGGAAGDAPEDVVLVRKENMKNRSGMTVRPTPDMELP